MNLRQLIQSFFDVFGILCRSLRDMESMVLARSGEQYSSSSDLTSKISSKQASKLATSTPQSNAPSLSGVPLAASQPCHTVQTQHLSNNPNDEFVLDPSEA